jgi:hypothetical protein
LQPREKVQNPYGGGKSVPEPQRLMGFGPEIRVIGPRHQVSQIVQ